MFETYNKDIIQIILVKILFDIISLVVFYISKSVEGVLDKQLDYLLVAV